VTFVPEEPTPEGAVTIKVMRGRGLTAMDRGKKGTQGTSGTCTLLTGTWRVQATHEHLHLGSRSIPYFTRIVAGFQSCCVLLPHCLTQCLSMLLLSDPFVKIFRESVRVVELRTDEIARSGVVKESLDPEWKDFQVKFDIAPHHNELLVEVKSIRHCHKHKNT
jgi:hypothetical protein